MVVENYEKVFTDDGSNNIIKKDYNPLNKELYRNYEREGFIMKETKDIILNELEKELNFEEIDIIEKYSNIFIKIYRKGMIDCFNYYNK